jgi:rhamnogalacturonyl hydrolase YesR
MGTPKRIAWAEKIRAELIHKANYLNQSQDHVDNDAKALSDKAFQLFFHAWKKEKDAKWWIDNRATNVRDISIRIKEITDTLS